MKIKISGNNDNNGKIIVLIGYNIQLCDVLDVDMDMDMDIWNIEMDTCRHSNDIQINKKHK